MTPREPNPLLDAIGGEPLLSFGTIVTDGQTSNETPSSCLCRTLTDVSI
jgi:hypothetical protein